MNKRQRKKKERKYIPVWADEFNLITMTDEERERAFESFKRFRERYAYRRRYKDLKNAKPLVYFYPPGEKANELLKEVASTLRRERITTSLVTQNLNDMIYRA